VIKLEKEDQTNTKGSRRKEILNRSKIEKKNSSNISEIKSWFFSNIKIDKPLARLTKKKEKRLKLLK